MTRLPVGNQTAVLTTVRREALTALEARGVIDLLQGANPEQEHFILAQPREALLQAEGVQGPIRDLRLSPGGNRVARQLRYLLDALNGMANWLRYPGLAELKRGDRLLLGPRFERLSLDSHLVATLVDDLLGECQRIDRRTTTHEREASQRDHPALAGETSQGQIARELGLARTTVQHVIHRFAQERSGQVSASSLPSLPQRSSSLAAFNDGGDQYRLRCVGSLPGRSAVGDGHAGSGGRQGDHYQDQRQVVPCLPCQHQENAGTQVRTTSPGKIIALLQLQKPIGRQSSHQPFPAAILAYFLTAINISTAFGLWPH